MRRNRRIQIVDVSLVMLVVMQVHGLGVEVRLQRVVPIR